MFSIRLRLYFFRSSKTVQVPSRSIFASFMQPYLVNVAVPRRSSRTLQVQLYLVGVAVPRGCCCISWVQLCHVGVEEWRQRVHSSTQYDAIESVSSPSKYGARAALHHFQRFENSFLHYQYFCSQVAENRFLQNARWSQFKIEK